MVATLVEVRDLTKRWGSTVALESATLEIESGITGLLGSNGAGKTTLLGLLLGLHDPTSGSVSVLGLDPASAGSEVRERIGYAPEHHDLPPDLQAVDFVRHMAEIHGLPFREANSRANDALWLVGLGEERLRPIGTMSTGQRQRVKLAQAFAHDPELVLLDEPTDGLDPVQREQMLWLIGRLGHEFGVNIVMSSHLLEEIERVCERAVILREGKVAASAPLGSLESGTGLVVELDDSAQEVAERIRSSGFEVAIDRDRLLVDGDDPDVVVAAVAAEGASLRRMAANRRTLEDVFLDLGG